MAEQIRKGRDLFGAEHPEVRLPVELATAVTGSESLEELETLAVANPKDSGVWAALAAYHLSQGSAEGAGTEKVTAYACARTGYHRGLDALRSNGWRGTGPVPWSHEPNRGVLRAIMMLATAARTIGEEDEYIRCLNLVNDCDPGAADAMSTGSDAQS
ncbi:MAG: DUF3151 domain-containing protein [Corynebacterium sp.]|jgi:hypothetical protein|uniref:DUF3151 domain-containing protein n=1 Tax=unclassified Corynebacterium TaxID=2624378 RepID=UPI000962538C|nr:DUF3151 domain-containing protein [Corynebacterium sp. CNJ-954]OLT52802.1 hypothetical protein BJF89_04930 [Corynebacterium sp. CNJ-954]